MGNYGNTLDRWYLRVVAVWPRDLAARAEAGSQWALSELRVHGIRDAHVPAEPGLKVGWQHREHPALRRFHRPEVLLIEGEDPRGAVAFRGGQDHLMRVGYAEL
jgi:hypothetical protein